MISLALFVLNLVLWVWFIGWLATIPIMVRHLFANNEPLTIGIALIIPLSSVIWFLQLEDIIEELEDAFGFDATVVTNKVMDYELFKFNNS